MTFKDICLEHGYTMLDDFCAEIMTEFGTYMINLSDSTLVLFTKERVLEQGFIPFTVPVENMKKCLPNASLKAIKRYLNIWERDYYLIPKYKELRNDLLHTLEKLGNVAVIGNHDLEELVLAVYRKGLADGMPYC